MNRRYLYAAVIIAGVSLATTSASAMTIKEFRKFSGQDQSTYIGAAVSMLAYSYAANGNVSKARCIQNWYFGQEGVATPGPHEIAVEMDLAEHAGPDKYHVEGVILGVTDKACPAAPSK